MASSNRLIERTSQAEVVSPRFSNPYDHAAFLNANIKRDDVEWIVDANSDLKLVDRADWTERRTKQLAASREDDRQRYNWRQRHPITEDRERY